jgi:hypothetical protein
MRKFSLIAGIAAGGLLTVALAMPAAAQQAVGAGADVKDRELGLTARSVLRDGPSLLARPITTVGGQPVTVRGDGKCTDAACPVIYENRSLWARRSRLVFGTAATAKPTIVERAKEKAADVKAAVTGQPRAADSKPLGKTRYERGDKGEDVARIQEALKKAGVFSGEVDGNYGRGTRAAVTEFQQKNKLKADGIAGRETLRQLGFTA